jgi:hypothetical protein
MACCKIEHKINTTYFLITSSKTTFTFFCHGLKYRLAIALLAYMIKTPLNVYITKN